jgi:hypothetical protein
MFERFTNSDPFVCLKRGLHYMVSGWKYHSGFEGVPFNGMPPPHPSATFWQAVTSKAVGTKALLTVEADNFTVEWYEPRPENVQHGQPEELRMDPTRLTTTERWTAKGNLGALPYEVAAAVRRNAAQAGDQALIELLDEANVAVDVKTPG